MSDLIKCKYCNNIHDKYYDCDAKVKSNRLRRKYKYSNDYKLYNDCYNTRKWRRLREEILKDNNYMCEICLELGKINCDDLQVHHIEKVKDNQAKMFDKNNLIVVCRGHHKQIEGMNKEELLKFIKNKEGESKKY